MVDPPSARVPQRDLVAVAVLAVLFVVFVGRSWLAWGYVDADYGREMFVPLRLAQGDIVYRDIRYPYGPFSPYLHALGYALFGPHLNVLYASGVAATALVVIAAFVAVRQVAPVATAALATGLVMVDLMFVKGTAGTFSYVFPYAYPALHGVLFTVVALAGGLRLAGGGGRGAAVVAGAGVGMALLSKPEFGIVALAIAVLALFALALTTPPRLWRRRALALAVPALGLPALGYGVLTLAVPPSTLLWQGLFATEYFEGSRVIAWQIAGLPHGSSVAAAAGFLASYYWDGARWYLATVAAVVTGGVAAGGIARWPRARGALRALGIAALAAGGWLAVSWVVLPVLRDPANPPAVLELRYAAVPVLCMLCLLIEGGRLVVRRRRCVPADPRGLRRALLAAAGLLLLIRVPAALAPGSYANFLLPVGVLLAVHVLLDVVPAVTGSLGASATAARRTGLVLVCALGVAIALVRWELWALRTFEIASPRGTLRLSRLDPWPRIYAAAIDVIRAETPENASILAVPRETALYFLADRPNRLYETSLVVVVRTEAAERRYITDLERDPPALVLISNRPEPEYGRTVFGVGYDRLIFGWIRERYRPERLLQSEGFAISVWRRLGSVDGPPADRPRS